MKLLLKNARVVDHKNKLDGIMRQGTKNQTLLYQQNTRGLRHDGYCGAATFYAMFNS